MEPNASQLSQSLASFLSENQILERIPVRQKPIDYLRGLKALLQELPEPEESYRYLNELIQAFEQIEILIKSACWPKQIDITFQKGIEVLWNLFQKYSDPELEDEKLKKVSQILDRFFDSIIYDFGYFQNILRVLFSMLSKRIQQLPQKWKESSQIKLWQLFDFMYCDRVALKNANEELNKVKTQNMENQMQFNTRLQLQDEKQTLIQNQISMIEQRMNYQYKRMDELEKISADNSKQNEISTNQCKQYLHLSLELSFAGMRSSMQAFEHNIQSQIDSLKQNQANDISKFKNDLRSMDASIKELQHSLSNQNDIVNNSYELMEQRLDSQLQTIAQQQNTKLKNTIEEHNSKLLTMISNIYYYIKELSAADGKKVSQFEKGITEKLITYEEEIQQLKEETLKINLQSKSQPSPQKARTVNAHIDPRTRIPIKKDPL